MIILGHLILTTEIWLASTDGVALAVFVHEGYAVVTHPFAICGAA